jgi:hypothetical protein
MAVQGAAELSSPPGVITDDCRLSAGRGSQDRVLPRRNCTRSSASSRRSSTRRGAVVANVSGRRDATPARRRRALGDDRGRTPEGHGEEIAINLRAATGAETFDFLCRAYALSRRERDVVSALPAGLDTQGVSKRLFISRHTVRPPNRFRQGRRSQPPSCAVQRIGDRASGYDPNEKDAIARTGLQRSTMR